MLVYTKTPSSAVADAITLLTANGAVVSLIGPQVRGYERAAGLVGDRMVRVRHRAAPVYVDPANPPRRWSPTWIWVVVRNLWRKATLKPARKLLSAPMLWAAAVSGNPDAVRRLDEADVMTAIDPDAVYPVWKAARRNQRAAAINGLRPTLQHLGLVD